MQIPNHQLIDVRLAMAEPTIAINDQIGGPVNICHHFSGDSWKPAWSRAIILKFNPLYRSSVYRHYRLPAVNNARMSGWPYGMPHVYD